MISVAVGIFATWIALLAGASAESSICQHDATINKRILNNGFDIFNPQIAETDRRQTSFQPIRIVFSALDLDDSSRTCTSVDQAVSSYQGSTVSCTSSDVLTIEKRSILLGKILPGAVSLVGNALQVLPNQGNLTISTTSCVAPLHSANLSSSGVAADFLLFLTAAPTSGNVVAWANWCALSGSGRPIAGHINFGPAYLSWNDSDAAANDRLVRTAAHEILHAFGVSYSYIQNYFPNSSLGPSIQSVQVRGKSATVIATPKVVIQGRNFFQCASLSGIEVEDEGGAGSALSHWDKRVLLEEIMTASGGTVLSAFTLALLEDSGHYRANPSSVEPMVFGAGGGCSFVTSSCNTLSGGRDRFWCFDQTSTPACTFDRKAIGICDVSTFPQSLPPQFQYFADPTIGGPDFSDHCPWVRGFSNRNCVNSNTTVTNDLAVLGFSFGKNSRCFQTSGLIQSGLTSKTDGFRCLETRCLNGIQVEIRVGSTWIQCPQNGASASISAPSGYSGTITCPTAADFCDSSISYGTVPQSPAPVTYTLNPTPSGGVVPTQMTTNSFTSVPGTTAVTSSPVRVPVPTSSTTTYAYQIASSLATAQFTPTFQAIFVGDVARILNISTAQITIVLISPGTGTYEGATIVRFTTTVDSQLSESTVTGILISQLAPASELGKLLQPIQNSIQVVVDCSAICNPLGTSVSSRNIENTACICVCRNSFNGTTCYDCPPQYNGTNCDRCADGFIGYPRCSEPSECSTPATPRYTPAVSTECIFAIQAAMTSKSLACEQLSCDCSGGTYTSTNRLCSGHTVSRCQRYVCQGLLRECLYQEQTDLMPGLAQCSLADRADFQQGAITTRSWCTFDACTDFALADCPDATIQQACSALSQRALDTSDSVVIRWAAIYTALAVFIGALLM
jgi:leishmanolysin